MLPIIQELPYILNTIMNLMITGIACLVPFQTMFPVQETIQIEMVCYQMCPIIIDPVGLLFLLCDKGLLHYVLAFVCL